MSLLSGLFGSTGGDTKVAPPQPPAYLMPYLTYGLGQAKDIYQSQVGSPAYQGALYAGITPFQTQGANNLANFASGTGATLAGIPASLATANAGAGAQYGSNAQSIFGQASGDPTQAILSNAAQYANSPYADQLVNAATRDVTRTLNENDLPNLANAAAATGNTNSSRTGAMDAILQRGAADRVADISANIRGGLYNTGLGMAQNQFNQNLVNMLNANQGIGQAGTNAANYASLGQQLGFGNADAMARAGSIFQQDQQGRLDEAQQQFTLNDTRKNDLFNRYWASVTGSPQGGGSAYQTPGTTGIIPSIAGLGIAAYGAGLFG